MLMVPFRDRLDSDWFSYGLVVLAESNILCPSSIL